MPGRLPPSAGTPPVLVSVGAWEPAVRTVVVSAQECEDSSTCRVRPARRSAPIPKCRQRSGGQGSRFPAQRSHLVTPGFPNPKTQPNRHAPFLSTAAARRGNQGERKEMSAGLEVIADDGNLIGEGPIWDGEKQPPAVDGHQQLAGLPDRRRRQQEQSSTAASS